MPALTTTSKNSYLTFLDWIVRLGTFSVASVGIIVTVVWLSDFAVIMILRPTFATMKVNTTFGLLAACVALWLLHTSKPGSQSYRLARVVALIPLALGVFTLSEDVFGFELGIDQLVVPDTAQTAKAVHAGRMSPETSLSFVFVGMALLTLKAGPPRVAACGHWLAKLSLFIAMLALVGYAYGAGGFYEFASYTSMAVPTAGSFFVLSLSVLAADPAHGIAHTAVSDTAGGLVCRRLFAIPILLFAVGWASMAGQKAELFGSEFGLALMVSLSIAVCVITVASTAATLDRVDITRKRSEGEIIKLNAGFERRIRMQGNWPRACRSALRHADSA